MRLYDTISPMNKCLPGKARKDGVRLGPLSTDFLAASEGTEGVSEKFLEDRGESEPLSHTTVITCMSTLKK